MEQLLQLCAQDLTGSNIETYVASESIDSFRKMVQDAIDPKDQDSDPLQKPVFGRKHAAGTDVSEDNAPTAKRAKFKNDEAIAAESKPVAVYNVNDETKQEEAEDTQKIQRHIGLSSTKLVSSSATSSLPTGGTNSSVAGQKQSVNSSSIDSSPGNKVKGINNSSDSGYGLSSSSGISSSPSKTSDAIEDSTKKKEVKLNVALAPTFVICLLRKDNSKVWCELTLSVRVKSVSDELGFDNIEKSSSGSSLKQANVPDEMVELLLCFRPVTQGLSESSDITSSSHSRENGSHDSNESNGRGIHRNENY